MRQGSRCRISPKFVNHTQIIDTQFPPACQELVVQCLFWVSLNSSPHECEFSVSHGTGTFLLFKKIYPKGDFSCLLLTCIISRACRFKIATQLVSDNKSETVFHGSSLSTNMHTSKHSQSLSQMQLSDEARGRNLLPIQCVSLLSVSSLAPHD